MTLLDVQHIKKIYKTRFQGTQVEALKNIHFTVEKGEYVAIMGESGSGKSTLLNILAMLDQPTEGRVYLNGTDTSTIKNKDASSFRREKLGFVFQDFNLLDTLSVKDNILLPLVLSRRPVKEMMSKVDSVSRELGIHLKFSLLMSQQGRWIPSHRLHCSMSLKISIPWAKPSSW